MPQFENYYLNGVLINSKGEEFPINGTTLTIEVYRGREHRYCPIDDIQDGDSILVYGGNAPDGFKFSNFLWTVTSRLEISRRIERIEFPLEEGYEQLLIAASTDQNVQWTLDQTRKTDWFCKKTTISDRCMKTGKLGPSKVFFCASLRDSNQRKELKEANPDCRAVVDFPIRVVYDGVEVTISRSVV